MKRSLQIIAFLLLALVACNREDLPPKVYRPSDQSPLTTDDSMKVAYTVTDDHLLKSTGHSIQPTFDSIPGTLKAWRINEIIQIAGNTFFFNDTLLIPDSVSGGKYELAIFATDDGMKSDTLKDDFILYSRLDTLLPVLDTIIAPDTVLPGEDISVNFTLRDDKRLAFAHYTLTSLLNDSILVKSDTLLNNQNFKGHSAVKNVRKFQRVRFEVIFHDWVNNKVRKTTDIIIKEN